MRGSWPVVRIGDLVHIEHGWPFQSEFFTEDTGGVPIVVSIGNFRYSGGFRFESTVRKAYAGEYPAQYKLDPGEILLVMTCQTTGGEILGVPACVPDDGRTYLHNQRIGRVVPINSTLVHYPFLYWAFLNPEFNRQLCATASGSKILHTSPGRIESAMLPLPPLGAQQAIAHILGSLDDKIELNRRTNETLEAMARALFKSWFVDFDPVRAKSEGRVPVGMDAETAKLFPSGFEEIGFPMGPVPHGWSHGKVRDACEGLFDGPHATPPEAVDGPIFLGIKNFLPTSLDLSEIRHISELDYSNWTRRVVPDHLDIVFTYEATLGFFGLIPPGVRCCLGRRTALVRPRSVPPNGHFLFHWFVASPFQQYLRAHRQPGSTVDRILLKDFPSYPVLLPTPPIVARFETIVAPVWARFHGALAESETLRTIRNTLLPKLISGEIRIKDAEKLASSAL